MSYDEAKLDGLLFLCFTRTVFRMIWQDND